MLFTCSNWKPVSRNAQPSQSPKIMKKSLSVTLTNEAMPKDVVEKPIMTMKTATKTWPAVTAAKESNAHLNKAHQTSTQTLLFRCCCCHHGGSWLCYVHHRLIHQPFHLLSPIIYSPSTYLPTTILLLFARVPDKLSSSKNSLNWSILFEPTL